MNLRSQRLCAWCAPIFLLMLLGGLFFLADFVPPPAPDTTPQALADLFAANQTQIRLGLLVAMLGSGLLGPFIAVISVQLKRIEGPQSPLTYAQLALGVMLMVVVLLPMTSLAGATYRAERSPEAVQVLSDQAWLLFIGAFYAFVVQMAVIGIAILQDDSPVPVFPRWLAYLNFWCAIGSVPAAGLYFVKDGPAAWNGVLAFWVPVVAFGAWVLAMFVCVLRTINAQASSPPLRG
jgi:hypothetical protein